MAAVDRADKHEKAAFKQYYVAVGTLDAKLATLADLIKAFQPAAPLGLVVCCGSRDSLDAVCAAALGLGGTRVWCLHADMSEREIDSTVQRFKAACTDPSSVLPNGSLRPAEEGDAAEAAAAAPPVGEAAPAAAGAGGAAAAVSQRQGAAQQRQQGGGEGEGGKEGQHEKALIEVLATTDVCLRVVSKDLLPLNPTLLVSYNLPARKEVYLKRVTTVLGSRSSAGGRARILVHFTAAGQLEEFRAVEAFAERPLEVMPVHVTDILSGAAAVAVGPEK